MLTCPVQVQEFLLLVDAGCEIHARRKSAVGMECRRMVACMERVRLTELSVSMNGSTDVTQNEARLEALRRTSLLDSPPEEAFDRLTRMATTVLRVPAAIVSL